MSEEHRPGFYKDINGEWQPERRTGSRRSNRVVIHHHDRRSAGRRKSDQSFEEREARQAIADAIEDLANPESD
jgi:hypothetical protein